MLNGRFFVRERELSADFKLSPDTCARMGINYDPYDLDRQKGFAKFRDAQDFAERTLRKMAQKCPDFGYALRVYCCYCIGWKQFEKKVATVVYHDPRYPNLYRGRPQIEWYIDDPELLRRIENPCEEVGSRVNVPDLVGRGMAGIVVLAIVGFIALFVFGLVAGGLTNRKPPQVQTEEEAWIQMEQEARELDRWGR